MAPGTPEVTEFAAAELGARIGRSPYAATHLIADALDLQHRHPHLWARVQAGEVRASYARHVVTKTRDLEPAEAAYVDAAVAESADGRIAWSRFEALVDAKVAAAAPSSPGRKSAATPRSPRSSPATPTAWPRSWSAPTSRPSTAIEAAVKARADRLTETIPAPTDDERRVLAVLLLATRRRHRDEPATCCRDVLVHLYGGTAYPADAVPRDRARR